MKCVLGFLANAAEAFLFTDWLGSQRAADQLWARAATRNHPKTCQRDPI